MLIHKYTYKLRWEEASFNYYREQKTYVIIVNSYIQGRKSTYIIPFVQLSRRW
jgi:hypothetical protein